MNSSEPDRKAPSAALSARMSVLARKDTKPELAIRRVLHAAGLRYRLQVPVPGVPRRTIDIAFTRARLAVFVDGCFWHSCPEHGTKPAANSDWWAWKLARTKARDHDTNQVLAEQGWDVLRLWEHEDPEAALPKVVEELRRSQMKR